MSNQHEVLISWTIQAFLVALQPHYEHTCSEAHQHLCSEGQRPSHHCAKAKESPKTWLSAGTITKKRKRIARDKAGGCRDSLARPVLAGLQYIWFTLTLPRLGRLGFAFVYRIRLFYFFLFLLFFWPCSSVDEDVIGLSQTSPNSLSSVGHICQIIVHKGYFLG
jgi:hypothetical protein